MRAVTFRCESCNSTVDITVTETGYLGSARCRVCDTLMDVDYDRTDDD